MFFGLADGFAGHTAVLALFDDPEGEVAAGQHSSLHHLPPCITWH